MALGYPEQPAAQITAKETTKTTIINTYMGTFGVGRIIKHVIVLLQLNPHSFPGFGNHLGLQRRMAQAIQEAQLDIQQACRRRRRQRVDEAVRWDAQH